MTRLAAIFTCLVLAGCSAAPSQQTQSASLGENVQLAPGESVVVKSANLQVRLVAVTGDSRCPRDATCVWAGEVRVLLEIQVSARAASQVEIVEGGSTVAEGYAVTVVRVEPERMTTAQIAPQDYRATLKIDKVG